MIGIYCITNKVNGKKYIGQSWNINKRYAEHKTTHKNDHMGHAIRKYGFENFELSVLRTFSNNGLTQIFLDTFERKYILEYNTTDRMFGYNKNTGGGSASRVNDEIKEKISKSKIGKKKPIESIERYRAGTLRYIALHGSPCKGIPKSEETKKKISASLKGKPWTDKRKAAHIFSPETREKMRKSHTGLPWSKARWDSYYARYGRNSG
jgi:group I intron endonuclease